MNEALTQLSSSKTLLKAHLRHMGGSCPKLGGEVVTEDKITGRVTLRHAVENERCVSVTGVERGKPGQILEVGGRCSSP